MSDEATVRVSLNINKDNLSYQSQPQGFTVDVDGVNGPTPGAVTVSATGTDISLSQLTVPGMCHLRNIDDSNYVEYGIKEPSTGFFYPLGEIGPGESYVLKLSRNIRQEYTNTGTGTSAGTNTFHMKANGGSAVVVIEAFER